MARKKKGKVKGYRKFLMVAGVLIAGEVVFLSVFHKDEAQTIREAINTAISNQEHLPPERREQLRIQLAVEDYMMSVGKGTPPKTLDDLVPKYFDRLPINPVTNQPFAYKVANNRPIIGEPLAVVAKVDGGGSSDGEGGVASEGEGLSKEQEDLLIASLDEPDARAGFVYDPTGKRDPFLPFSLAPVGPDSSGRSPLEKYEVGQLKVTAILEGFDQPTAIVENDAGRGFTVRKGTKIGMSGGEVVEILKDRLMILESQVDFTGQKKTRTIEMKLRLKEREDDGTVTAE